MTEQDWRDSFERRMAAAGFSARSLSIAAGLNPTAVRDILIGRSKQPRFQTLYRLARVLGCSVEELTDPDATNPELPLQPTSGRAGQREAPPEDEDERPGGPSEYSPEPSMRPVPLLDLEAIEDGLPEAAWPTAQLSLPVALLDYLGAREPVILTVRGDDMAPTLNRRDLVLVDRAVVRPRRDGIYALLRPGQLSFRRLHQDPRRETVTLLADNPNYTQVDAVPLSELEIFGLVLWQGRAL